MRSVKCMRAKLLPFYVNSWKLKWGESGLRHVLRRKKNLRRSCMLLLLLWIISHRNRKKKCSLTPGCQYYLAVKKKTLHPLSYNQVLCWKINHATKQHPLPFRSTFQHLPLFWNNICRSVAFSRTIQSNEMDFFSSSDNIPKESSRVYKTEKGRVVDTDNTFQDDSRSLEIMDSKFVKRSTSENTLFCLWWNHDVAVIYARKQGLPQESSWKGSVQTGRVMNVGKNERVMVLNVVERKSFS